MASLMRWLANPNKNPLARMHKQAVDRNLRKYGVRYDDMYDPQFDLDIQEALNRLPKEVVDARNQRLKRCMDLSLKHSYLPKDLQAMQTPFRSYIQEMLALVQRENAERKALELLVKIHKPQIGGVRYDDLYDPQFELDVREALDRLPSEIVDARNARLKRCLDLSLKHSHLPKELQAMQTPFRSYIQEMVNLIHREKAERKALGALPLYQRTIP